MKVKFVLIWLSILTTLLTGCSFSEIGESPDLSDDAEYVRLHLRGGDIADTVKTRAVWSDQFGEGSLKFRWERTDADSEHLNLLSLVLTDGDNMITTSSGGGHTALMVTPDDKNPNLASFETEGYYLQEDLDNAAYCYAVSGSTEITADPEGKSHFCSFQMPSEFTQSRNQDPSFLREYMYMYATAEYVKDDLLLLFNHIPATFRFIITNRSTICNSLQDVSVFLTEESSENVSYVASSELSLNFKWTGTVPEIVYDEIGHACVTTNFSADDSSLKPGEKYIAYSMALPLQDSDAFKGKTLNFVVRFNEGEEARIQFNAEDFAAKNGGVYNWAGGKSYTIKLEIGDDPAASGMILPDNRIEINASVEGEYILMYEDADGIPLADYAEICKLTVSEMAYYEDFIDVNVAPREAESIGIYDSSMKRIWCISISDFKPEYTQPLYSVGILSDVHIVPENTNGCMDNFKTALTFFNEQNVKFNCVCGDISESGYYVEQYAAYRDIVTNYSPDVPVYETTGNHDCRSKGINLTDWKEYTGEDILFEVSETLPDGSVDHYLFLGMTYWGPSNAYLSTSVTWLEEMMAKYKDERCFIITHMFFPERSGNMNQVYPSGNWLSGTALERLQALCDNHPNSYWFSGHSHWKWSLQKYDRNANIHRYYNGDQPASGWSIHIPACTKPVDSDGETRVSMPSESEGAIMHVYEDHIVLKGIDFKARKYLPIATYKLTNN